MKSGIKILLIIIVLSPIAAFLVLGMFVYGLLPYPPKTIKKVYKSQTGATIRLKGVKQQGWGSDGFFWDGKYWESSNSKPQKISAWIEYSESFLPRVYFVENLIVIIEDLKNFQVKTIENNWQNYSLDHRDFHYISSIHSQIESIQKDLSESAYPYSAKPYIDKFIPETQELVIRFSVSPYNSSTLSTMNLFVSATGDISVKSDSIDKNPSHPSFKEDYHWITPDKKPNN